MTEAPRRMNIRRHGVALFSAPLLFIAQPVRAADDHNDAYHPVFTSFELIGIVQSDYSRVSGDKTGFDLDDHEFRRGRLGAQGVLFDTVTFKAELDFDNPDDPELIDAYISMQPGGGSFVIMLGQFKTANSLDEQTSSTTTSTLERAAFTDAFELARGVGAAVSHKGKRHTLTLGAFGRDLEDDVLKGYLIGVRATYEPVATQDLRVHTGVSFRYRDLGDQQPRFIYRQDPVAHAAGAIVATDRIAQSDFFFGAEAVIMKDRYWAAGEIGGTVADCAGCLNEPVFIGGYVEAGAFFNGRRTLKGGQFGRPKIYRNVKNGGSGAFSLVARLDTLDLNDAGVSGGHYESATLGADWWPTTHTRVGVNIYAVHVEFGGALGGLDPAFAAAIANGVSGEDAKGVTVRLQLDI